MDIYGKDDGERKSIFQKLPDVSNPNILELFMGLKDVDFIEEQSSYYWHNNKKYFPDGLIFLNKG